VGSATSTHNVNTAGIDLATTTASGDRAIRQTYRYFQYFKGKPMVSRFTCNFLSHQTNIYKRIGMFDANNGVGVASNGTDLELFVRSKVSGSVVTTPIPRTSWNRDKLDGTGPSGINLDIANGRLWYIDYAFLGFGAIRFGVYDGEDLILVHEEEHEAGIVLPYMQSGNQPFRYEIENVGVPTSAGEFSFYCGVVSSDGGSILEGLARSIDTGTSALSVTTTKQIVGCIRIKPSLLNVSVQPLIFSLLPISGVSEIRWELVLNPDIVGAVWTDVDVGYSQQLTGYTSFSNGIRTASGYIPAAAAANASSSATVASVDQYIGFDIDEEPIPVALVAQTISGSASLLFSGDYKEYI
jgi:hypothetical protein